MSADRLTFAIRVSREVHGFYILGRLLELRDELLLAFDDLIVRAEVGIHRDCEVFFRQVLDVPQRSLDNILVAQILADGFRFRRRLDNDERFSHN